MVNKITVLHENSRGIRIIREDMVKRSVVKVKSGVHTLKTYRMNNVPFYEHPYLSWANLDCCGGWAYDEEYLKSAVQKHKKLAAGITVRIDMEKPDKKTEEQAREMVMAEAESLAFDPDETEWDVVFQHMNGSIAVWMILVARNGCLSDYYSLDDIVEAYQRQSTQAAKGVLEDLFSVPLIDLFVRRKGGFDYGDPRSNTELIITGLGFGYPIESTASLIHHY